MSTSDALSFVILVKVKVNQLFCMRFVCELDLRLWWMFPVSAGFLRPDLPQSERCRRDGTNMDALFQGLILFVRSVCTRRRRPRVQRPFSNIWRHSNTRCSLAQLKEPANIETHEKNPQQNFKLRTLPKLPLPSTVKKWKSSTAYFLNLGIVVAGAVIRPDRWNCANVYEVSVRLRDQGKRFQLE